MPSLDVAGLAGVASRGPRSRAVPALARWRPRLARAALSGLVLGYLAIVLLGPALALLGETWRAGPVTAVLALGSAEARSALSTTLALVGIALGTNAVLGTAGAIALVRHRFPGRRLVDALCDLPLAVSPVMIGLAFVLLVGRDGWLGRWLDALGVQILFAFPGLVLATLFVTLPYTVREVAYALGQLGTTEEEAAATLGASPWQTFWRVTLPNIRAALGHGLIMTAARTFGEFGAILVLGGSISGRTRTATTYIHDALEERRLDAAYGMALLLAASSVVLLLALESIKRRRAQPGPGALP